MRRRVRAGSRRSTPRRRSSTGAASTTPSCAAGAFISHTARRDSPPPRPMSRSTPSAADLPRSTLVAYGVLGLPFAMAALPVYVYLPKFYGEHLGMPIAVLGALLLVLRIADGVLDPLLGALTDRARTRKGPIALAAPFLAAGMVALFSPPAVQGTSLVAWLALCLAVVY